MKAEDELERLRIDNERMRILLDHMDQAILTFGEELIIDPDYTDKVLDIFEKSTLELIDISISELLFTPSEMTQAQQDALETTLRDLFHEATQGAAWRSKDTAIEESLLILPTECRINTGSARKFLSIRWRWIYTSAQKLHRIMLIIEDETEARELQFALDMQQERLLAMGETSANFAHEIASPTQHIGLTNRQLSDELTTLQKEILSLFDGNEDTVSLELAKYYRDRFDRSQHLIDEIDLAQKRIRDLHEAVRNYFRQSVAIEEFSLQEVIRECFILARTRAKSLCLSFECPAEITLRSIRSQWMSVISNLLHNACDILHEHESQSNASLHVFVKVQRCQGQLSISFEDAGPGVPEALRSKIFESSFTTKKTGEGTGLGLAMVLRIVEAHGGRIIVDRSQQLGGARFLLIIPIS